MVILNNNIIDSFIAMNIMVESSTGVGIDGGPSTCTSCDLESSIVNHR